MRSTALVSGALSTNSSALISENASSAAVEVMQGLMKGLGWHNLSSSIQQADGEQKLADQKLATAIKFYLEEQDEHSHSRLITALNETLQTVQFEYNHAVKKQKYYQEQAKIEAEQKSTSISSYIGQWSHWIYDGLQNFFGSTTEQQIEKYQKIVEDRQIRIEKISNLLDKLKEMPQEFVVNQSTTIVQSPSFPAFINLSDLNGLTGFRVNGEVIGDRSGWSVKGGRDINGDGYDDLLIGATNVSNTSTDTYHQVARSYLVFGGTHISSNGQLDLAELNGTKGFKLLQDEAVSSGISVSFAGDVNGDTYIDLIIGAPYLNLDYQGEVFVVFGKKNIGREGNINLLNLNGSNGFKIINSEGLCGIGDSVASSGDINGDGYDDLLLGCGNGKTLCAYGIFGSSDIGKSGFIDTKSLNGTVGFKLYCDKIMDPWATWPSLNFVSSAGDVNGDSYLDFLIGSPFFNSSSSPSRLDGTGRTYAVFGNPQLGANGNLTLSNLNGTNGLKIDGEKCSLSGVSIDGTGDINNDGYNDFLIGAPYIASEGCFGFVRAGRVYVVFGGPILSSIDNGYLNLSNLNEKNGFIIIGDKSINGEAGYALSRAKDVNGDGIQDIMIASPSYYPTRTGTYGYGRTYIIFGNSKLGDGGYLNLTNVDGIIGFNLNGDYSYTGQSVSEAGDVNGDGVADLIIGAPNSNSLFSYSPPTQPGHSYVVFGDIPPVLVNNTLNLYRTENVLLNATHLAAFDRNHDNNSLVFVPTNITHGYFENINQLSIPLKNFTQLQVQNQQIRFIHDGRLNAPTYKTTVRSAGIALTGPSAATVNFNPMPIILVNNRLVINQSQTALLTIENLSAFSNNVSDSGLVFTITDISHGLFSLNNAIVPFPIVNVTQQMVYSLAVSFTHDGSPYSPSYQVSVSDNWIQTDPAFANITFNIIPFGLINNKLNINQNETFLLTSQELLAERNSYADPNFKSVITNMNHGFLQVTNKSQRVKLHLHNNPF